MAYNNSRNPLRALQNRIGQEIVVRLKDSTEYRGNLKEYDNFMNLIIENVTETIPHEEETNHYSELFVRGNNILFILPEAD
ncbi:MAG: ribonucleoprotein [Candidatus Lokiarchaeota archaeon]|nr:ribonucleoprotein [Candidatus Harpocratesius repetitus]